MKRLNWADEINQACYSMLARGCLDLQLDVLKFKF